MNVLAIGLGEEQVNAIEYALSIGLYVIGVDRSPHLPAVKLVHEFYEIDLKNQEKIVQLAKEKQISFIIPSTIGALLTTIGRINDELNLSGVSSALSSLLTDKVKYYEYLNKMGLFVPQRKVVHNPTFDIAQEKIKNMTLPIILKPSKGSGSRGVIMIENGNEIDSSILYALNQLNKDESLLIEEFVSGQEYGVDFRVEKERITILSIRQKEMTPLPYRQEIGYFSYSSISKIQAKVKVGLVTFFQSFDKLKDCIGNLDVIIKDDLVYFLEMSLRPAGLGIMYNYLVHIIGFNPVHNMIDVLAERDQYRYPVESNECLAMFFFNLPEGTIIKVPSKEEIMSSPSVVAYELNLKAGDTITRVKRGSDILNRGFLILKGNNYRMIEIEKNNIFSKFIIKDN